MFKPNKLLKVVSIILIVFAALGIISLILGYIGMQSLTKVEGLDQATIDLMQAAYSPLNLAIGFGGSVLTLVCGILGVSGKAFKAAMGLMSLYIVIEIVSIIITGFAVTGLGLLTLALDFVLPILYLWGLYQSKE